ncbi:MerR family transcriptional regulator [Nocardioides sp. CER19]|uniref:MerR family transcriptional regulator n=1 Tax=Nocardioides sp. CER19 TaxID=3038538 RepID=UPI002446DCA6|nr:MerR family transcriptional regulator [Nocardioides sp. CER19]MDH2412943.1 MerR family transcriptional regulator [Nocardioides sp. CER19]
MLTIGQLASYAGVTIRAVRHYHQVGLLPEPERDGSGYRTYGAEAVVRLIRIRTLRDAGVPLTRVQELLDADEETFAAAVVDIDRQLRADIRELQAHRRRIAQLAAGDSLALPDVVVDYLDRLRATGAPAVLVDAERDAWILMAARWPEAMPEMMADKVAQLSDPRTLRLYGLFGQMVEGGGQEGLLQETADLLVTMFEEAEAAGTLSRQSEEFADEGFVALMDSFADGHEVVERLRRLLAERGWTGWTVVEKA